MDENENVRTPGPVAKKIFTRADLIALLRAAAEILSNHTAG